MSRPEGPGSPPPGLPGYRYLRHLGTGGNAQVYLYRQELPSREVAVKVLSEPALSEAARRRFRTEADVTAGLAHRHIVQVFEANVTADGRPYIVMPYYPRPNLSARARGEHLSVAEVLRIGVQIGSAVETSHRHDVLHRDIKPQNILTDSYGEPALADFGIAATAGGDGADGLSVPWSPPEILYGTTGGDRRSDVYSLAATLWHVLAGRSPFEVPGGDNTTYPLMRRIKSDPVPGTGRADVPGSLERLLRQAMAKDPAARPQTAMEFIRGLQAVEQELRLPVTQPILPAGEPAGGAPDGDMAADDVTRSRGPRHLAPFGGAAAAADREAGHPAAAGETEAPTRARGPLRPGPRDPAAGGHLPPPRPRERQFPPGPAESATRIRQVAAHPGGHAAGPGSGAGGGTGEGAAGPAGPAGPFRPPGAASRRGGAAGQAGSRRVLAITAGGGLLAVAAAVAVLALARGGGQPAPGPAAASQPARAGSAANAIGPGAAAPGVPVITARRVSAAQVLFSWTYANPAAGDTFLWRRVSGTAGKPSGATARPELSFPLAAGQNVCIVVVARHSDGEASNSSEPACWPRLFLPRGYGR